jgi:hypothetical protein
MENKKGNKQMKIYKGWKVEYSNKQYIVIGTQSLRQSSYVILKDTDGNKSSMERNTFLDLYSQNLVRISN